MSRYIAKRLLLMIPVVIGVIFTVYLIMYLSPGDATTTILGTNWTPEGAEALRDQLGLNQPFLTQFFNYLKDFVRGDFGMSYITKEPVLDQVKVCFPNTALLVLVSITLSVLVSIPIGIRAAVKPNSFFSAFSTAFALIGIAAPGFWIALLLVLLFSVRLGLLPASGLDNWKSVILPAVVLSLSFMASISRMMRSSMIESLGMDYVRTARAKGVKQHDVVYSHALKNALLPPLTVIGSLIGEMLGGAVICESVFAIPGMGRLMVESVLRKDTPCVLAAVSIMAICVAIMSLVTDLAYAFFDPRVKAQYMRGRRSR